MERWRWALVALVLLTVVLLAMAWALSARRRKAIGSDRAIDLRDRRRRAEHEHIDLRALTDAARTRYVEEWLAIQERYPEDPVTAVTGAEALLQRVLADRGRPDTSDHPRLAESLHAVDIVRHRAGNGLTSTEDLREAMVHYRIVFLELLAEDDTVSGRVSRSAAARRD